VWSCSVGPSKPTPEAIRILLTGYTDIDSVISAINSGQIYRYVTKPWDPVDLSNAIDKAIHTFELREEVKEKNLQLEKALTELQTLDQAKSHFMILVNHELKTPLTSILSFLELLKESSLTGDQSLFVDRIERNAFRLQRLIEDVLQIVQAETGQLKLHPETIVLDELVANIPPEIKNILNARDLQIHTQGLNVKVHFDYNGLRNVFHRLLHNAARFADENSTIEIRAETKSTDAAAKKASSNGAVTPSPGGAAPASMGGETPDGAG